MPVASLRLVVAAAAVGYADGNAKPLHELICDPITVLGGSDAGAHVRQITDAGMATYSMTHWSRDKAADDPYYLPLEFVVKKLTHDGARLFGMTDRGTLEPGAKADVNLIDYDKLSVSHPEMRFTSALAPGSSVPRISSKKLI